MNYIKSLTFRYFCFVSGVVYVAGSLDYEIKSRYILVVEAYDLGVPSRVTSTNVTIIINDVNDNHPVIIPQSAVVHVNENIASRNILQVFWGYLVAYIR